MTDRFTFPTILATWLLSAALLSRAAAAAVMLPGGEPDPNCPALRLWLRADSGIEDRRGRGSADPDFDGTVAAWRDRSPQKFHLAAAPRHAPLLVPRQAAAGNRPTVAFNGDELLTRSGSVLNDRPVSTVVLVVQPQPKRGAHATIFSAGKGQNRRERLGLVYSNEDDPAWMEVSGLLLHDRGERPYRLDLALAGDGRAEGRLAVIISTAATDRRWLEFHDGLGDLAGGQCDVTPLGSQQSACDKCSRDFSLGGSGEEEHFCGQIAEMMVFDRDLSIAQRREILHYLRRRYELDMTDALLAPGTLLLPAEGFEGDWKCVRAHMPDERGRYLRGRHVTVEAEAADEGIKTTVDLPRDGLYHVWVRALEDRARPLRPAASRKNAKARWPAPSPQTAQVSPPATSALKTFIQGKELRVTHAAGPQSAVVWRDAGTVPLKAGPAEIVVRGEGPGHKDCDSVLVSPAAATPEAVEEIWALVQRLHRVGGESHITAVFANGLRLDGSLLTGWRWTGPSAQTARPATAEMPALVCLQFDRPDGWSPSFSRNDLACSPGFSRNDLVRTSDLGRSDLALLEFQNGDRLVGTICGCLPGTAQEGQTASSELVVRPPKGFLPDAKQTVSVRTDWLRRIVFEPSRPDCRCPPKTLIRRDGRWSSFRTLRWGADSISVLSDESLDRIPLTEIAEVRSSNDDGWETYYRELSVLDPQGRGEIVRVETTEGMAITTSTIRSSSGMRAWPWQDEPAGDPLRRRRDRSAAGSFRLMQPVWSREPIPVPWSRIRLLWRAEEDVVPLSRFAPQQVVEGGALGGGWHWQADRNVAGGVLRSGGPDYLWGFGVHAPNEMVFAIPEVVRAFRGSVGIDAAVGGTGRAIARLYAGGPGGPPLYQSRPLVGSDLPAWTGEITLPPANGGQRRLVLVTENTDPLGIGDHVDWLEPVLLLDPARLHAEVGKRAGP